MVCRAPLCLEKYEGYADEFSKVHFGPQDAFIVIFHQRNSPPGCGDGSGCEVRHLPVIAIVSRAHCQKSAPAHPPKEATFDVADVVIDNLSPVGDCAVGLQRLDGTPAIVDCNGVGEINMLRCETAGSSENLESSRLCCPVISLSQTMLPMSSWRISTKRYRRVFALIRVTIAMPRVLLITGILGHRGCTRDLPLLLETRFSWSGNDKSNATLAF